jgi:hypothetical protein
MVLNWHENRPSKEIPPRWMWHVDHEITDWFERISNEQDAKSNPVSGRNDEEAPMMTNELAAGVRGR